MNRRISPAAAGTGRESRRSSALPDARRRAARLARVLRGSGRLMAISGVDEERRTCSCPALAGVLRSWSDCSGCRDFAMLTLLARLGSRAAEVSALRLDDLLGGSARSSRTARDPGL